MKRPKALIALLLSGILTGCTIGTGHRTVVRAACIDFDPNGNGSAEAKEQQRLCDELGERYPHLIADSQERSGEGRILRIDPEGRPLARDPQRTGTAKQPSHQQFRKFLRDKYGSEEFKPVELSFSTRDRGVTPPFLSIDPRPAWLAGLTTLFLNTDRELSVERRIELGDLLEAQLRNVADLDAATAPHHTAICSEGCFDGCRAQCEAILRTSPLNLTAVPCSAQCLAAGRVYYYYPRASVDFSSSFLSTTAADRLSYLAVLVRIRDERQAPAGGSHDKVRFIDFRPKDADIIEFSRGDLTQGLTLTAGANVGATGGESITVAEAPRTRVDTAGTSSGATAGISLSETLASKLADSIEKKTTGILEDGRAFFADFRSLRQIRVAGAYNFDLMLEVPSKPSRPFLDQRRIESVPIQESIKADVYLLGVVRHVHDRGRIGLVNRVPESENDHVFEQVVLRILPEQTLWVAPRDLYFDDIVTEDPVCRLQVLTNREEAGFVVRNENSQILASGTGRKADLSFPQTRETCGTVTVTFFPVILTAEGKTVVLEAESRSAQLGISQQIVEGTYRPAK
ncbi:MAG TPA: hypothetical protein VF756_20380 [Thermoanaerobaculia bacterium]